MKLLIVDDEPLIHISIEYSLKKLDEVEIEEIRHAYNGPQMFQIMEEFEPNLALVDIQLPGINGLQAIQQAKERWPDTIYYVMSSYSEFEYAREALRLNVVEYLLKPLDPETLKKVTQHVLQQEQERSSRTTALLSSWLEGALHGSNVSRIFPKGCSALVLLMVPDRKGIEPDAYQADGVLSLRIPCSRGYLVCLASRNAQRLEKIRQMVLDTPLQPGMTAFLSDVEQDPQALEAQLRQCLNAASMRVLWGIHQVYSRQKMAFFSEKDGSEAESFLLLQTYLNDEDFSKYTAQIPKAMAVLRKKKFSANERRNLIRYLEAVTELSIRQEAAPEEIEQTLSQAGDRLLQNKNVDKLDAVLAYVAEHYCEDVSLATLSSYFDLTPNYLGTLLRNRVGVKYTDYLTHLRLSKAKELLSSTNQSVRVIAEQVGYYSLSYFSKLFQEKEGCTPAEFRSKHQKQGLPR